MRNIFTENDIEILISTMNQTSLDFLFLMFPSKHFSNYNILIINQSETTTLASEFSSVRIINSEDVGLSKSRNLAITNAIGKICVIADDDIVYQEEFLIRICNAYNKFPDAAVINFCAVNAGGKLMKKYPLIAKSNLSIFDVLNTTSFEMTFNNKVLDTSNVKFDENFGLGGVFEMGEEAAFLTDLRKKNKQLAFEPSIIVLHAELTSSDKKSRDESYYISGALFTRIFKSNYIFWLVIKLFFDLKQNKIELRNIKPLIRSANHGHKDYQRIKNK
jgi:glycosyltransferase involved in cell wall biosynthesis